MNLARPIVHPLGRLNVDRGEGSIDRPRSDPEPVSGRLLENAQHLGHQGVADDVAVLQAHHGDVGHSLKLVGHGTEA